MAFLVHRLTNNGDVVAFKMGAGKARGGCISESICNRRATRPPAHFRRNPPGRGQLAVSALLARPGTAEEGSRLYKTQMPIKETGFFDFTKHIFLLFLLCYCIVVLMARATRVDFPGAWYHVLNRGIERRAILTGSS